jgi:hypothetical protein
MKRIVLSAMFVVLAASCDAHSVGGVVGVSIVDRDTGVPLSPYYYRGEYWVAGRPGARYSIQIRNHLGERLMAVTSVDGVNVISGATAGWDQTGYVFGPGESYQITGWRKSDAEVAAFTFTESPDSYAERTGRPANVGIIGVAVFREQPSQPVYSPPVFGQPFSQPESRRELESDSSTTSRSRANLAESRAADAASAGEQRMVPAAPSATAKPALRAEAAAPKLGTGHGMREYSYVNHTEFSRMHTEPDEVIRIHYDSLDHLLAMGVIKRERPIPSSVNPFPATQQYVPDPVG